MHALALQSFYSFGRDRSCLQIVLRDMRLGADDDDTHCNWAGRLPEDPAALWSWCLEQPQDTLLALLAHLVGQCVDAIQRKSDRPDNARSRHADSPARALGIDMASAFTPGVENYFSRISGAQIISALCEAKGVPSAPSWSKMKKAELAAFAAREIAGTGWLPEPMRPRDEQDINLDEAA